MVEGQEAQSHDLFLKSDGWLGMIEYEPVPKYFKPTIDNHSISFPPALLKEFKESEDHLVSSFHYIDDLGDISGDNFTLEAKLKNSFDEKWVVCQSTYVYFIGTKGAMIVPFGKLGCSSDLNLMLNDVYLDGKENDLSALSTSFDQSTSINIQVIDKELKVTINDSVRYTNSYNETMGELVGLRFKFVGLGTVEEFTLLNTNGDQVEF